MTADNYFKIMRDEWTADFGFAEPILKTLDERNKLTIFRTVACNIFVATLVLQFWGSGNFGNRKKVPNLDKPEPKSETANFANYPPIGGDALRRIKPISPIINSRNLEN